MPQPQSVRDADCYEQMMSEIRTPTSGKAHKRALKAGRVRLPYLARRLARQNAKGMKQSQRAQWQADLQLLRRMCIAQFMLRRRQLQRQGKDLKQWAAEPERPRQPGSDHHLIALANRVAAETPKGTDAQAIAMRQLLEAAAKPRPKAQTKDRRPQTTRQARR